MSTNRLFVLVIAVALAVAAALVIREGIATRANASTAGGRVDSALGHPRLSVPVTGQGSTSFTQERDLTDLNFYERERAEMEAQQPGLIQQPAHQVDLSAYYHYIPELNWTPARQVDLSAYYHYIPELNWMPAREVDCTTYYLLQQGFCH